MNFNPHDYQAYAIRYIEKHPVAAVLLDMGLGKTIISLTAVNDLLFDSFEVHRVLVVAPLRIARDTWPAEIKKWEHLDGLTYAVAVGTPKERKAALMQQADMMELDPKYASVILRRYVEDTGDEENVYIIRNGEKLLYSALVKEVDVYKRQLLTIDDQELLIMPIRIIDGNKTPEKVTLPVSLDDLYEVIIQLLAVLGLPVIISLVHRDDKPLVRALHVFNEFAF